MHKVGFKVAGMANVSADFVFIFHNMLGYTKRRHTKKSALTSYFPSLKKQSFWKIFLIS